MRGPSPGGEEGHSAGKCSGGESPRLWAPQPELQTFHWAEGMGGAHGPQPPEIWEQDCHWRGVRDHSPLVGEQVKLPVQLAHRDGLGVEHVVVDSLVQATTDGWLPFQHRHGGCQDPVTLGRQVPKSEPLGPPESRAGVGCEPQGTGGILEIQGSKWQPSEAARPWGPLDMGLPGLAALTVLLPEPVGPTSMRPCRTTVVS